MKKNKIIALILTIVFILMSFTSCAELDSWVQSTKGSIIGAEYNIEFYDNLGSKFMTAHGKKIDMEADTDSEGNMSSVINITIDGQQMVSCGSTAIFAEAGLNREVDFSADKVEGNDAGSITSVATLINGYRNAFGKPMVLIIQSQLGVPICAYSGDKVYWEVCDDLPKTTKLMIDGKAIYVHRANFQIIDLSLL